MEKSKRVKKQKIVTTLAFRHWLYKHKIPLIPQIIGFFLKLYFSFDIPASIKIERNLRLAHGAMGAVIHRRTVIGDYTKIYQNVAIGSRNGIGPPKIGEHVVIGAGACILGDITIGDYAQIGANAVVVHDVPAHCTAVGIPAKIIEKKN